MRRQNKPNAWKTCRIIDASNADQHGATTLRCAKAMSCVGYVHQGYILSTNHSIFRPFVHPKLPIRRVHMCMAQCQSGLFFHRGPTKAVAADTVLLQHHQLFREQSIDQGAHISVFWFGVMRYGKLKKDIMECSSFNATQYASLSLYFSVSNNTFNSFSHEPFVVIS